MRVGHCWELIPESHLLGQCFYQPLLAGRPMLSVSALWGMISSLTGDACPCLPKPKGSALASSDFWGQKLLLQALPCPHLLFLQNHAARFSSLSYLQAIPKFQPGLDALISLMRQKRHKSYKQGKENLRIWAIHNRNALKMIFLDVRRRLKV